MPDEPRITDEDRRIYRRWLRTCSRWSKSKVHRRNVLWAKKIVGEMQRRCDRPYISWSGGKDSTALVYLVCVDMSLEVPVVSLVTDIEPPNTERYMTDLARMWGLDLHIIRPPVSFKAWLAEHAADLDLTKPVASGHTAIGGIWDDTIREWEEGAPYDGNYWGIRRDESDNRELNFQQRGSVYQLQSGFWRAAPLSGWSARDVYAYCETNGVDLMQLYRCVRLSDHPGDVRKAMLLPDTRGAAHQAIWLRAYYPSVFAEFRSHFSQLGQMT